MIRLPTCLAAAFAPVLSLALIVVTTAGCGGGAVTDNTPVAPTPISITPATATLYSGLPATFTVTGGNGNYTIASSDQLAVPLAGGVAAGALTVVPGAVSTDTPVTLTVRDSVGSQVSAALTVKPRTVTNVITVTPSPTQAAVCGTAVCSGGDAELRTTLAQNGVPISNREVRFDVTSGDVRFILSSSGGIESLATSTTARTDSTGTAIVRIRALADAPAQTALLQITDVSGGFSQRTSVAVFPVGSVALAAAPATIVFTGLDASTCAMGTSADVIVFGGRPPYQVTRPAAFGVSPTLITASNRTFTVTSTGTCASPQPITIVDANGSSASILVSNLVGPAAAAPPPFVVSPTEVTLDSCNAQANVTLAGGLGTNAYYGSGSSESTPVTAVANGSLGIIRRASGIAVSSPVQVSFSDGRSSVAVGVTLAGTARGTCP